jgi:CRISPR-associated protein Csm1
MTNLNQVLISYATWQLGARLGQAVGEKPTHPALDAAIGFVGVGDLTRLSARLSSIFSWLEGEKTVPQIEFGVAGRFGEIEGCEAGILWSEFSQAAQTQVPGDLDSFLHVYSKFAATIPTHLPGISLYEWFKTIAAQSVCCERESAGELLLVAGDLPGIQQTLYTITSAGAARSLRGRSMYLQLLSDAILRALRRAADLPEACVIYNAGGNFKLLAPASALPKFEQVRTWLNERLIALHGGELCAAIAFEPLGATELAGEAFSPHVQSLAEKLEAEKHRWFAEYVATSAEHFERVFLPSGRGGLQARCPVCHIEVEGEGKCDQCASFEELANDLREPKYLTVKSSSAATGKRDWNGKPAWSRVLRELGFDYKFSEDEPKNDSAQVYALNVVPLPSMGAVCGRRYLANVVPVVRNQAEAEKLREQISEPEEHASLKPGAIRSTTLMADADATGIARWGVLRMDVDNLGLVFQQGRDVLQTSALSAALSRFFEGKLNDICQHAANEWTLNVGQLLGQDERGKSKLPYVIYAGGDDLFIVGCWDVLPYLAWRIHQEFESETGGRLTVSGGISIFPAKFPLYQAAEIAGNAEAQAKAWTKAGARKNAVNFLGQTLPWSALLTSALPNPAGVSWTTAWNATQWFVQMIKNDQVSHAFLNALAINGDLYLADARKRQDERVPQGRWAWRLAYYLARAAASAQAAGKEDVAKQIREFGEQIGVAGTHGLTPLDYLSLSVRWAEYLLR